VFDHALVEPIGSAPTRAVLALWRQPGHRFEPHELALVSALVGSVAATINRLLVHEPEPLSMTSGELPTARRS